MNLPTIKIYLHEELDGTFVLEFEHTGVRLDCLSPDGIRDILKDMQRECLGE